MLSQTSTSLLVGLLDPANDAAWRRFYARYTPMLLAYARRVGLNDADAQDVVAETLAVFTQAYRAGRYDRSRARLKSWLGGIAAHKVRKLRERRRPVSLDDAAMAPAAVASERPDAAFEREWELERLNQALELLRREAEPETYQAFDLYVIKQWPVARVASFLHVTANAVYISKSRCIRRLRSLAEQLAHTEE